MYGNSQNNKFSTNQIKIYWIYLFTLLSLNNKCTYNIARNILEKVSIIMYIISIY